MGAAGGIIMGFFGAVFALMTLALPLGVTGSALSLPFLVFAAFAMAAGVVIKRPGGRLSRSKQARRVIMWSTIGEVAGLFIAANLAVDLGHRELLLAASALVVGLHFLPMAYGIPFRPFYAVGLALLIAAAIGFALRDPLGSKIAGFSAAAALWTASLLAIRREVKMKAAANRPP